MTFVLHGQLLFRPIEVGMCAELDSTAVTCEVGVADQLHGADELAGR